VHHARIVQPRREPQRHHDAGNRAPEDHEQRAPPAARQRLQILLQFLLHALPSGRALGVIDRIDPGEQPRIERVVERQARGRARQAEIQLPQFIGACPAQRAVGHVSLQRCLVGGVQIAVQPILQAIVPLEVVIARGGRSGDRGAHAASLVSSIRRLRARWSKALTVPSGSPRAAAVCS
jgi:hypothetical protein